MKGEYALQNSVLPHSVPLATVFTKLTGKAAATAGFCREREKRNVFATKNILKNSGREITVADARSIVLAAVALVYARIVALAVKAGVKVWEILLKKEKVSIANMGNCFKNN